MGVSVRREKPGGPYYIFIRHGNLRKSKRIGYSKSTADKIADIIRGRLASNDLGIFDEKPKIEPSFKELSEQWLELDIKTRCRNTTYSRYKSSLRLYVNPVIGQTPIDQLLRPKIKNLLRSLVKKNLSRSSIETAKNCISGTCEFAIDDGIIPVGANPAREAMKNIGVAKKSERKPVDVLTAAEAELIIATTKKYRPDYYHLVLLAFRTGMRLGEILALKWGSIDWQRNWK
jgi:integrase